MTQILEAYVGLQWGDEGKGKIVDERVTCAQSLDDGKRTIVIRYQGGNNAGHSVYVRDPQSGELKKFVTHAAPSGLTSNADIAIGPHVAFNPGSFLRELEDARDLFHYSGNVLISERVGVLFEHHRIIDAWYESQGGTNKVGTTRQGIGPFYSDNARRTTRITFGEYISDRFPAKLHEVLCMKRVELLQADVVLDTYEGQILALHAPIRAALAPYAQRLEYRLQEYLSRGDHIFIEGAQGTGLDLDMGTIPDQTSSHLLAPHAFPMLGLSRSLFSIYGVEKVYPTRVGEGVLPTLALDAYGENTAQNAGEFGATTGRKRRVGYPDWVFVRRSAMINDCDGIYLMRADNVQDVDLKACIAYRHPSGEVSAEVPLSLEGVQPEYNKKQYRWHLWDGPKNLSKPEDVDVILRSLRKQYVDEGFHRLPDDLLEYVEDHDNFVGVPTMGISIGPSRGETVLR